MNFPSSSSITGELLLERLEIKLSELGLAPIEQIETECYERLYALLGGDTSNITIPRVFDVILSIRAAICDAAFCEMVSDGFPQFVDEEEYALRLPIGENIAQEIIANIASLQATDDAWTQENVPPSRYELRRADVLKRCPSKGPNAGTSGRDRLLWRM